MAVTIAGQVGPQNASGQGVIFRQGASGELVVQELHGRFYEQVYRGNVYSIGQTAATALSSTTATATGLTGSATPILAVWNPSSSTVNLVLLQLALQDFINNVTSVALGAFVIVTSTSNGAISTGLTPFNNKTLASSGSAAKGFAGATALTGLTNNLVIQEALELPTASGLLTTTVAAATPTPSVGGTINLDGQFIVPPGGVWGIMNTVSVTTHSVYGRLMWEEVPV